MAGGWALMAACPTCRINHAPYTCAQYADLRRAENRADAHRVRTRSASARRACPVASTLLLLCAPALAVRLLGACHTEGER
jgi:hypothetical protein